MRIITLLLILNMTVWCGHHVRAEPAIDRDYNAYSAATHIGADIFLEWLRDNVGAIRTSALLSACGQDGLAKAVEARVKDRKFATYLSKAIQEGKFQGLPDYAALSAQAAANSMSVGYSFGYKAGISLVIGSMPSTKGSICDAAIKGANSILR